MNKVKNQNGEQIIAIGVKGSHVRNKTVFNLTIPKLIQRIRNSNAWSDIKDTSLCRDLEWICEDDNIPKEQWGNIINSAFYLKENEDVQ